MSDADRPTVARTPLQPQRQQSSGTSGEGRQGEQKALNDRRRHALSMSLLHVRERLRAADWFATFISCYVRQGRSQEAGDHLPDSQSSIEWIF